MKDENVCPVFESMPKEQCSGCEVCLNTCPVSALSLEADSAGFLYPALHPEKCIRCNKCLRVCPMLNTTPLINDQEVYFGASHTNDEVLLQSASGGIFTFLVDEFKKIYPEGNVVGAIYSEDFKQVKHFLSKEYENVLKMKSSKYFQSCKQDIYAQVREKLENDEAVFFSGTPCEVTALYYYLGKQEYKKLWTMDFICKGSSSPQILRDFVEYWETKYNSKAVYINMRYKWPAVDNWIPQFLMIKFENGRKLFKEFYNTELGIGFQILQRGSCHNCPFRENKHYSDFTIGDLHDADKNSEIYNHLGVSAVIINTDKGQLLWESFHKKILRLKVLDKETIYSKNRNPIDPRSEILKKQLINNSSVEAVRKSIGLKTKIKMIMPVMLLRKVTTWRREHKR